MNRLGYAGVAPIGQSSSYNPVAYGGSYAPIGDYGKAYGPVSTGVPVPAPQISTMGGSPGMSYGPAGGLGPGSLTPPVAGPNGQTSNGDKPGFFGADGFQLNDLGTLTNIIGGFGSLWNGIQANKLAKESLAFTKESYKTNLANTISSYNLALEDRMNSRHAQKNMSQSDADAAVAKHKLGK